MESKKVYHLTFHYNLIFQLTILLFVLDFVTCTVPPPDDLVVELTDANWDQIQKGQWMIGFFDKDTEESLQLENDWAVFAVKCKSENINVGKIFGHKNPGLNVRFLVATSPMVFFVKNGVAHKIPKANRDTLMDILREKKWSELKPVGFLSNPFSIQISLLSHLFIHAVNLYKYEDAIVQQFFPYKSATDIAFGLTFITVGTILGLFVVIVVSLIEILFFSSKDSEEASSDEKEDSNEEKDEKEDEKTTGESISVRKRKK